MCAAVHFTVSFTEIVIGVIAGVACKRACFILTCVIRIRDIALFAMCAAVCGGVSFTGVVIDVIARFASGELTCAVVAASACRGIVSEFVAVLAGRSAVGIVILAEIFLIRAGGLLADIAITLFGDTRPD